jgi:RNA polymerase sigma factor (sigma-70 family)
MAKGKDLKKDWDAFIQTESEQAFYELYTHYFHYLSYIGIKKGFPDSRVKDSINDLFLYLWENPGKLQHTLNHHNYIITAFLRKLYRKENFSADQGLEFEDLPDFGFSPSAEAQHIHQNSLINASKILQEYVGQLPQRQRSMIYQKFYLGLSYKEIADSNDVSINTVYNTIYKAVDKLRILIGKEQLGALSIAIALLTALLFIFVKNIF